MLYVVFMLLVAILCLFGTIRCIKQKNLFGAGFSAVGLLVFGFFSVGELAVWAGLIQM